MRAGTLPRSLTLPSPLFFGEKFSFAGQAEAVALRAVGTTDDRPFAPRFALKPEVTRADRSRQASGATKRHLIGVGETALSARKTAFSECDDYRRLDSNQRHPAPQAGALAN